ncbi:CvpA family protein [Ferruginibacter lapsinanis]|uniref:CvpA family protein n=1 Tax=Ferruginibacter lapsinanis TaxID=563172 RepID=UPI001E2AC7AC|nr:CvpA family protein [Ferruginibacter lapsinanis]UEG50503.1 CvpA family protein [Ferruginibacter lapsinanis]
MIDIFFAILIIIAIVKGYQKGLIIALFSIVAFIIGIVAAVKLSSVVATYLQNHTSIAGKWLPVISFAVVFLGVILLVRLGAKVIEKTFQFAMLGWVNRIGGIILYALLYTIIFSILLFYAEKIHLLDSSVTQASQTYPYVQPWAPKVIDQFGKVIPIFKGMFTALENFFSGVPDKI